MNAVIRSSRSAPMPSAMRRDGRALRRTADAPDRVVRYLFSEPTVARDLHVIEAGAWHLDNFRRDPVFLWAHDVGLPPIGRVIEVGESADGILSGTVEYMPAEISPFADTIYRMVDGGWLNAVSVSWVPLAGRRSTDPARRGGIDFTEVDLLEVSQVPVPSLPTALKQARIAGIDTAPVADWAERLLDLSAADPAVLAPLDLTRAAVEDLRRTARMPVTRKPSAPRAAAVSRAPSAASVNQRGLYDVASLACLLAELGWIEEWAEAEAGWEQDGSQVPAMLTEALKQLGAALIAMTVEEVAELLGEEADEAADDATGERSPAARFLRAMMRRSRAPSTDKFVITTTDVLSAEAADRLNRTWNQFLRGPAQTAFVLDAGMRIERLSAIGAPAAPARAAPATAAPAPAALPSGAILARAGKRFSADSERCIREVYDTMTAAGNRLIGLLDTEADADAEEDDAESDEAERSATGADASDEAEATERRAREAEAIRLRYAPSAAAGA